MSNKTLAVYSLALIAGTQSFLIAADSPSQSPSAAASPTASASPAASATPSATASPSPKSKDKKTEASPSPTATPGPRAVIDGLSPNDLHDTLDLLKSNYVDPTALSDQELDRAKLQGLLDRLAPGVSIFAQAPKAPANYPFLAEVIDGRVGYVRLGTLAKDHVDQMDAALQDFNSKSVKAVVLDLRTTPESSDFDLGAEVIKRFCPKGQVLFTVKKTNAKQERIMTSNMDPSFTGMLIVLADKETAGAGEAIAAVLRMHANAMVIGQKTAGEAVEFSDLPLHSGKILRVAVAEVVLPDNVSIFPGGVKPDLPVEMSADAKREIMQKSQEKWDVSEFIYETDRPHLNEAALVAGKNPEIDAIEAAQKAKSSSERGKVPLKDVVLQRALDFVTSVGIFEKKPGQAATGQAVQ